MNSLRAIDIFLGKLKFTYVECEISTECTFGTATFCGNYVIYYHMTQITPISIIIW